MSKTETISITNYAPDRWARMATTLDKKGLHLTGNDGEAKDFGADVKFHYDPASQLLTLTLLHGPHLHSFDDFAKKLQAFIEGQE